MQDFYMVLALLTAGVSLAMGGISLFIGKEKKDRGDLIFGFMSLCLVIFILLPPIGFIQQDQIPYSSNIIVKRVFIFTYYALFPWFILGFTGYPRKQIPFIITMWVLFAFVLMLLPLTNQPNHPWILLAIIGFTLILIYGFVAGLWQYRNQNKVKARWFIIAMVMYGVFFSFTAVSQIGQSSAFFLPMHMHFLFFALIMGLSTIAHVFDKHKLEKLLQASDKRWQLLMQNAAVFVMELDKKGNILYINDFGINILGYRKVDDLLSKNWFDTFVEESEATSVKSLFERSVDQKEVFPYLKGKICSKQGKESTISWVNFFTYNEEGEISGLMYVGRDVSTVESAFQIINELKSELQRGKDSK
ncbi:MAG TPA: 7TM diverse intracellular signaling domain-containing protein [Cyclobacteriaceae bacterium]